MEEETNRQGKFSLTEFFKILGCGFKTFGCLILLSPVLLLVLIVFKPPFLWNGVVSFLNADLTAPEMVDVSFLEDTFKNQITQIGENKVILTENELSALLQFQNKNSNIFVEIMPETLKIFFSIDNSIENLPLFAYLTLHFYDNSFELIDFGTKRISSPVFLTKLLNQVLLSFIYNLKNTSDPISLTKEIIGLGEGLNIKEIKFLENKIEFIIDTSINIF